MVGYEKNQAVIIDREADHPVRLRAIADWQDRVNGKPRQTTEVTGSIGIWDLAEEVDE